MGGPFCCITEVDSISHSPASTSFELFNTFDSFSGTREPEPDLYASAVAVLILSPCPSGCPGALCYLPFVFPKRRCPFCSRALLASKDQFALDAELGPPARCPFSPFFGWEGSPTKIEYRKKGTLILSSLEDLGYHASRGQAWAFTASFLSGDLTPHLSHVLKARVIGGLQGTIPTINWCCRLCN